MRRTILCALLLLGCFPASAANLRELLPSLKEGGHVIVFRHGATDNAQQDIYPFNFADMKAQRQLSEKGKAMARQIGGAITELHIPIGAVFTSRLNRAVETGRLLSGKDVTPVAALTDSGAGSAASMAKPGGDNVKAGRAGRDLVKAPPQAGTNTLLVTHKTNIADAFGKEAGDVEELEAFVWNSSESGTVLVGRVKPADWISQNVRNSRCPRRTGNT
jgi:hypothetical protein